MNQESFIISIYVGGFAMAVCMFFWGYFVGYRKARLEFEVIPTRSMAPQQAIIQQPPPIVPEPVDPDEDEEEPLIFGRHHFIQYSHEDYDRIEPWGVCDFKLHHSFNVSTKEQAIELMAKADAYRDAHPRA